MCNSGIFVDSSYWIAQHLAGDRRHTEAIALEAEHSRGMLVTSKAVVAESWTFLRRRVGHGVTMAWLDRILAAPHLRTDRIDEDLVTDARGRGYASTTSAPIRSSTRRASP